MSATYNPNLTSEIDWVRFLLGDTDVDNALISNEEIQGALNRATNDLHKALGYLMEALSNDPRRLMKLRDAVGGAMTLAELQSYFSNKARQWIS